MQNLTPDYEFENVTKIDEKIFEGKDLIIFDIDNTLFYPETVNIREDILGWFMRIKKKYKCVCFSNSFSIKQRKDEIVKKIGCELYISHNKKPSRHLFKEIVEKYNVSPKNVVVVGDFRFTDVFFGKRSGAKTILVKPFSSDNSKRVKILRKMENLFFRLI